MFGSRETNRGTNQQMEGRWTGRKLQTRQSVAPVPRGATFQLCCTFSLFLLLTAQHTISHVTRLLPARTLQYIEVES